MSVGQGGDTVQNVPFRIQGAQGHLLFKLFCRMYSSDELKTAKFEQPATKLEQPTPPPAKQEKGAESPEEEPKTTAMDQDPTLVPGLAQATSEKIGQLPK